MTALQEINEYLARRGLGQLGDAGLLAQFGYMIRDHAHFQSLLICCAPELRTAMYEALAPNVHGFKVKPLADYLIEAARDAEARQFPVIGEDGQLERYRPPEAHEKSDPDPRGKLCPHCYGVLQWHVDNLDNPTRFWVECVDCDRVFVRTEEQFNNALDQKTGSISPE